MFWGLGFRAQGLGPEGFFMVWRHWVLRLVFGIAVRMRGGGGGW